MKSVCVSSDSTLKMPFHKVGLYHKSSIFAAINILASHPQFQIEITNLSKDPEIFTLAKLFF
jgi:hypothetical protein